jgi:hypothetical protein
MGSQRCKEGSVGSTIEGGWVVSRCVRCGVQWADFWVKSNLEGLYMLGMIVRHEAKHWQMVLLRYSQWRAGRVPSARHMFPKVDTTS